MKKILLPILILFSSLFSSCEEVIDLELDSAPPRLVIEASIMWLKGTAGSAQKIKLSTTTAYYNTEVPIVTGARIFVTDNDNSTFNFNEIPNTGEYQCANFVPKIGEKYTLTILYQDETYVGTEVFQSLAPITRIEQNNEGGFTGDEIEVKAYYNDPAEEENYYLYKYQFSNEATLNYNVDYDRFFQGNEYYSRSSNDDLKQGDEVILTHFGVSKQYYAYMNILIGIMGNSSGGPFQTPPATVRGNIQNITNPENYPLGYFYLGETDMRSYIIE